MRVYSTHRASRRTQPDDEAERDHDLRAEGRPVGRLGHRLPLREGPRLQCRRVAPVRRAVEDEIREEEARDVVEHQRGDDLVRAGERLEHARDQCPESARHTRCDAHRHDVERGRGGVPVSELERDPRGADCAQVQLTLGADVEELHAKGRGRGEPREEDRCRRDEGRGQSPVPGERRIEDLAIRLDRIVPRRGEEHCHQRERHDQRADRNGDGQPPRLRQPTLQLHPRVPPAMSRPISSIDADPAGSSPTISPS